MADLKSDSWLCHLLCALRQVAWAPRTSVSFSIKWGHLGQCLVCSRHILIVLVILSSHSALRFFSVFFFFCLSNFPPSITSLLLLSCFLVYLVVSCMALETHQCKDKSSEFIMTIFLLCLELSSAFSWFCVWVSEVIGNDTLLKTDNRFEQSHQAFLLKG